MRDFGKRLRAVRLSLGLDGPAVALAALGAKSTEKQRRDFANYLSRIERDKVKRVGLPRLDLIRKGFGFETLTAFFASIERQTKPDSTPSDPSGIVTAPTISADGRSNTPLSPDELVDFLTTLCVRAVEHSQREDDRALFKRLAVGFRQAAGRPVGEREVG